MTDGPKSSLQRCSHLPLKMLPGFITFVQYVQKIINALMNFLHPCTACPISVFQLPTYVLEKNLADHTFLGTSHKTPKY